MAIGYWFGLAKPNGVPSHSQNIAVTPEAYF